MLDLKNYEEKRLAGLTVIAKVGNAYAVYTKKFSSETGEELTPEVVAVDLQDLEDRKVELQTEINSIDAFIAEANAIKD